jgi:hypothetical protein
LSENEVKNEIAFINADLAIEYYEKVLEIDKDNINAKNKIEELKTKK